MRTRLALALAVLLATATLAPLASAQDSTPTSEPSAQQTTSQPTSSGSGMTLADYEQAQDTGGYNSDYIFAFSRGLGDSPMHAAAKVPLFIFTIPLDVVLLPFAALGGLF